MLIFYIVMKCKPKAHYLVSTQKKKCQLQNEIKMNLQVWVQNEINLHKSRKMAIIANCQSQKSTWAYHEELTFTKQHHNPNLKIVNILFFIIYFVICGKDYIEMTIKFETSKWELWKFLILSSYEFKNFVNS